MAYLFAGTLFIAAALLMLVQPLCARLVLPTLGGTPNVWNTCMVFFQTGLLAGYGYAHLSARWLTGMRMVAVQVALLMVAFLILPVALPRPETPPQWPTIWLLQALVIGVAVPFVVIAASGPMLQRWFAWGNFGDPYFLYVASNAGSFAGLLAYPFLVEPWLTLQQQSDAWRWAFLALLAATFVSGMMLLNRNSGVAVVRSEPVNTSVPNWRERLHWLFLALTPSSLLLSVTNYVSTDIAAIPLLWVVPLALYLLTFTLVFSSRSLIPHELVTRWQPLAVLVLMLLLLREATEPLGLVLALHLIGFFWIAMSCHGELARSKPAPEHLTEFYLWLALGGALGGVCNTLLAPLVFSSYAEYPLMIALACMLKPGPVSPLERGDALAPLAIGGATALLNLIGAQLGLDPTLKVLLVYPGPLVACYLQQSRPLRFGLSVGAVMLASLLDPGVHGRATMRIRSFFGVLRVTEQGGMRRLVHGNTVHGQQFLDTGKRREPLAYYHRTGPIGRLLTKMHADARLQRVGLVGLGAGSLAAYAQPQQRWTFFEIDPAVVWLARDSGQFTFLRDSRGEIDVIVGDARLTLQQSSDRFGVLIIDAFGSDAIPWHLLTREAMQLYRSRLQDDGILAFHISNRYVDLESVLANHAEELGMKCTVPRKDAGGLHPGKLASKWLFMTPRNEPLDGIWPDSRPGRTDSRLRTWTDDYANLLQVLRWRDAEEDD